jgi:hypothetical protein
MQRTVVAVAAGAALSFYLVGGALAQAPAHPPQRQPMMRPANGGPQFRALRERWRQLSPEQRQQIRRNAARWLQLPPEEREQLRFRDSVRRERIRREAEAALRNSGLQLEAEKRAAYEKRYLEERRRIDRQLRQELRERRQRELAPVVERLKREFTPQGGQQKNSAGNGSPKK